MQMFPVRAAEKCCSSCFRGAYFNIKITDKMTEAVFHCWIYILTIIGFLRTKTPREVYPSSLLEVNGELWAHVTLMRLCC